MKHKVGDKVRIKSKEWYEENKDEFGVIDSCSFTETMQHYCGKVATIVDVDDYSYFIDLDHGTFCWRDEIFEDDEPQVSETLLQDIANVIKSHNMGVQVSEQDGKLIIEPVEEKKEDDLPIDTPVMVSDANSVDTFMLRYYAGNGKVFCAGHHDAETEGTCHYDIIIPWDEFDPKDLGESMKFNIVK